MAQYIKTSDGQALLAQFADEYKRLLIADASKQLYNALSDEEYRVRLQAWQFVNQTDNQNRVRLNTLLKRNIDTQTKYVTSLSVKDIVDSSAKSTTGEVAATITQIGRVYNQAIDQRWRQVTKINRQVADQAIQDMLRKYDEVHRARARGAGLGYRTGERFTGGKLRAALASPNQAQVSLDGVTFINTDILDQAAKQWARLNFGAGSRAGIGGGGTPYAAIDVSRFGVTTAFFEDALGGSIPSFDATLPFGPKGAFYMPAGIWSTGSEAGSAIRGQVPPGERAGQAFFPLSQIDASGLDKNAAKKIFSNRQKRILTKGVQAWGFLEVGASSLARNLPAANFAWMSQIFEEAQTTVNAGIPGRLALNITQVNSAANILNSSIASYIRAAGNTNRSVGRQAFLAGLRY